MDNALTGDPEAALAFAGEVKVYILAHETAALLSSRPGAPSKTVLMTNAFASLANVMGSSNTTYDFTSGQSGIPLASTVPYRAVPRYRNYPANALQQLLLHNALARGAVSQWRQQQRSQAQTL
jgi:hypothetical protein